MHSLHHSSFPRTSLTSVRPLDHFGGRRRHPVPHSYSPSSFHGFVRPSMNPGGYPTPQGPSSSTAYRSSAPGIHGDYLSQSPRPSLSNYRLEHGQAYSPVSWAGPPGTPGVPTMPVQQVPDKWVGLPAPVYAVQQSPGQPAQETFTSGPMYAQYSPHVAPPPSYDTSQPQYLPAGPPPGQQLFVVANAQLVPGVGQMLTSSGQFGPNSQPPYQVGFVPAGQPVANQVPAAMPAPPQQAVSSAGLGCVVASPTQPYMVANQPVVMQSAAVNQPFIAQQYMKTYPGPNVIPQQLITYVVPPPAQPGLPPPPANQVYSVVTNQNVPQPSGPSPCIVQPMITSQRIPIQVAAVPNQFQPLAIPTNQLPMMPANPIHPMAMGHLQVVPAASTLQALSTNHPLPSPPANQMQSFATSQLAAAQPVYCYIPGASVASPPGPGPANSGPHHMSINSAPSLQQPPPAIANIQVPLAQN